MFVLFGFLSVTKRADHRLEIVVHVVMATKRLITFIVLPLVVSIPTHGLSE